VFSNQHKLTIMKSEIKQEMISDQKHSIVGGPITKLNAHQITRYTANNNNKKNSFIEKEENSNRNISATTKGPQLGSKPENNIGGDTSVINSSAVGSNKKTIKKTKDTKRGGSARPINQ